MSKIKQTEKAKEPEGYSGSDTNGPAFSVEDSEERPHSS